MIVFAGRVWRFEKYVEGGPEGPLEDERPRNGLLFGRDVRGVEANVRREAAVFTRIAEFGERIRDRERRAGAESMELLPSMALDAGPIFS